MTRSRTTSNGHGLELVATRPLVEDADHDPLVDAAADPRRVLLGEAAHGTH